MLSDDCGSDPANCQLCSQRKFTPCDQEHWALLHHSGKAFRAGELSLWMHGLRGETCRALWYITVLNFTNVFIHCCEARTHIRLGFLIATRTDGSVLDGGIRAIHENALTIWETCGVCGDLTVTWSSTAVMASSYGACADRCSQAWHRMRNVALVGSAGCQWQLLASVMGQLFWE